MICRAPWSAVDVTEHVFTTRRSASSGAELVAPRTRRSRSIIIESAWLTRQPKVMTEYFTRSPDGTVADAALQALSDERLATNVAPELHAVELHQRRSLIRNLDRRPVRRTATDDREHAAAIRHELSIALRGTRVEDHRVRYCGRGIETGDWPARFDGIRVTAGSEHDADVRLVAEA